MFSEQEIKDAFVTYSSDRDNLLPKRKVATALRALNIAVTEAEVEKLTSGVKSTSIDLATFQSYISQAQATPRPNIKSTVDSAANLFKTENGKVNLQDMKQVLAIVGEKLDDDEIEEFFANAQVDNDGNITAQDLQRLFAQ